MGWGERGEPRLASLEENIVGIRTSTCARGDDVRVLSYLG